jgi:hypothetical protein
MRGPKMRYALVVSSLLLFPPASAVAQVSIQIGIPNVSIGIHQPVYPQLVPVPGYPVYYAPSGNSNYFFYDGMYWVYQGDSWYASSWYNGPWALVAPQVVPAYILRVPVRYYRQPPAYFRGWPANGPPRWGQHWGHDWERDRAGWDQGNHKAAPPRAPLPVYQSRYSGNRYPQGELQPALQRQNYRYQPHDASVQQAYLAQRLHGGPPPHPQEDRGEPSAKGNQAHQGKGGNPVHKGGSGHRDPGTDHGK